jgi:uncharacterized damage-inducible protein DinB
MILDVLRSFAMSMDYARQLVLDLNDQQFTAQPIAGLNHAAWIIGHLTSSFQMIGGELGLTPWLSPTWQHRFGTGSRPSTTSEDYPNRSELLAAFEDGQRRISDALSSLTDQDLAQPLPDEGYRHVFPTLGSAVLHILTVHTAVHLGQLSAWRRAMGLPRVADPL